MNLKIEHGTYADLDAMEMLYDDIHNALKSGENYPRWRKGIYPAREDAEAGVENHNLFVARNGSSIVGSIILNH